jgi:hypothetical protein
MMRYIEHILFSTLVVEVEYKGRRSSVIITGQGASTLRIFG